MGTGRFFTPVKAAANPGSTSAGFFHSGDYTASSFSAAWSTRYVPDNDGLNTPVYELVLDKFGIPHTGGPSTGTLPGMDIRQMSAVDAIRLSLAESLIHGEWWDLYEDGLGGVYFEKIFAGAAAAATPIDLDIRQCIPSSEKQNIVDLVVVRGYKPPDVREVREFKDVVPAGLGTINPTDVNGQERLFTIAPHMFLENTCYSRISKNTVFKSYRDPIMTDEFHPQGAQPFYSRKEHESLLGYVKRISGMPTDPAQAARVKYEFPNSTRWYKPITLPPMIQKSIPGCASPGVETAENILYVEGSFTYQSPDWIDRYGYPWPLINKPDGILFLGNKLQSFKDLRALAALPGNPLGDIPYRVVAYVEPIRQLVEMSQGSSWTWTVTGRGEYEITVFFQLQNINNKDLTPAQLWEALSATIGQTALVKYSDGRLFDSNNFGSYGSSTRTMNVVANPGDLGYLAESVWLALDLDRPCVSVQDPEGEALAFAESFRMEAAPIVLISPPAPIAWCKGGSAHLVDQTSGIEEDSDPTTLQNFEDNELEQLQDMMQGNVIDVSLPFCDETQCQTVAETLFNFMHETGAKTYSLTCGPDSEPKLGCPVNGFDTSVVIDSIDYSFSDASSYTINVTLGPIFSNIGSWNTTAQFKKTETISNRKAMISWVAGDGANYRVEVDGLGTYTAVNATEKVFYAGETVHVTIYNNPMEE